MKQRSNPHRKWPAIDVLELYTKADSAHWNKFLATALSSHDVEGLKKTYYGLQAGMSDLAKTGLSSPKIRLQFLRWQKSIEDTAKRIFREKYPHPLDNPLFQAGGDLTTWLQAKRKRDQELEAFFKDARF